MYVNTAGKYLRKAIAEIKEIDEDILIPENVKRSGILYRMSEREKERGGLSSDDIYELAGVSRSISAVSYTHLEMKRDYPIFGGKGMESLDFYPSR